MTIICANCTQTIRDTSGVDPNVPWVHDASGNSYCDVAVPEDAVMFAGTPDRPEATPLGVTVRIENTYSNGHESENEVFLYPEPTLDALDEWWEDEVYPHTGDGTGEDSSLGSFYTATIIAAGNPALLHQTREWDG